MPADQPAIAKYRTLVADLHSANGSWKELEQRRAAASLTVAQCRAELDRAKPLLRFGDGGRLSRVEPDTSNLNERLTLALAEAERLAADASVLSERRNAASSIACKCRDLLLERGLLQSSDAGF